MVFRLVKDTGRSRIISIENRRTRTIACFCFVWNVILDGHVLFH